MGTCAQTHVRTHTRTCDMYDMKEDGLSHGAGCGSLKVGAHPLGFELLLSLEPSLPLSLLLSTRPPELSKLAILTAKDPSLWETELSSMVEN